MTYRLITLPVPSMTALIAGRLAEAAELAGAPLTPFFLEEAWLWRIRSEQLTRDPDAADWVARAALAEQGPDAGRVVGHIGFHGPPDAAGMVEVGYSVDPVLRRRGHARAMLRQELARTDADPRVAVVRATVAPGNAASLGTLAGLGFEHVGEQWDEQDGRELVFERSSPP
jgi:RimJ/RimL family protein N-acetyltransferase